MRKVATSKALPRILCSENRAERDVPPTPPRRRNPFDQAMARPGLWVQIASPRGVVRERLIIRRTAIRRGANRGKIDEESVVRGSRSADSNFWRSDGRTTASDHEGEPPI